MQLSGAAWQSNRRVSLDFSVRGHRRGPIAGRWQIQVGGVKEASVTDVDGGGLAFTRRWHPAVQQYLDPLATLRVARPPSNLPTALSALWRAHVDAVDDWIPLDRYLDARERLEDRLGRPSGVVCRGPAFLVRRYAKVLSQHGAQCSVSARVARGRGASGPLSLLHFGSSFVVASSFTAKRAG